MVERSARVKPRHTNFSIEVGRTSATSLKGEHPKKEKKKEKEGIGHSVKISGESRVSYGFLARRFKVLSVYLLA